LDIGLVLVYVQDELNLGKYGEYYLY